MFDSLLYHSINTTHHFSDFQLRGYTTSEIVLLVIVFAAAAAGIIRNITVMSLIMLGKQRLWSVTNAYLFQRAAAEIMVVTVGAYETIASVKAGYPIGYAMCYIQPLFVQSARFVSLVFLVLLTVDAYFVSRPKFHSLQYRWKTLKAGSSVTWAVAAVLAIPFDLFSGQLRKDEQDTDCTETPFLLVSHYPVLRFISVYFKHFVPVIIAWVYVSFSFPHKVPQQDNEVSAENESPPTMEVKEGEECEEENLSSLRSLSLALLISVTVCHIPYLISVEISYLVYNFYVTLVLFCMAEIHFALNPFFYIWYRKDLWQKLKGCTVIRCPFSKSTFETL